MVEKSDTVDRSIARVAARQYGVVTIGQLTGVGLSEMAVTKRARAGRLHRVHRGVYAVGHPRLGIEGRWMAAVLACGAGAVLSHGSAAALWGLLRPIDGPVHVSVPTRAGRRQRAGIRLHRCASLGDRMTTYRRGIPVTSVARTIDDLRGSASPHLHRRAVRQAEIAGFALGPGVSADGTRSDFERDFLRLCARCGFPAPEVNLRVGRWTVDFVWLERRLAVETDSYRFHRGSVAFEDDHARDLDLRSRGFAVLRFTERQLRDEPERVAADLEKALSDGVSARIPATVRLG